MQWTECIIIIIISVIFISIISISIIFISIISIIIIIISIISGTKRSFSSSGTVVMYI